MTPGTPDSAYAGAVSRLVAYVVDLVALSALFAGGSAVTAFLVALITGHDLDFQGDRDVAAVGSVVWWFVYFAGSWAFAGRTLGMGLLGLKVVRRDKASASAVAAVVRALAFPLSVALLGLGFLGILFHSQRRALHDLIAGTAVVYSPDYSPGQETVRPARADRGQSGRRQPDGD
jgi:uncharacterized RDD family membrane protein YckC